jgi:hypothetical protein
MKMNIDDYISWDEQQAVLINEGTVFCTTPNCSVIPFFQEPGCHACSPCCDRFKPYNGGYPPDFNIVARKEMDAHFYINGKEIKAPVSEVNGLQVYQFSQNQKPDNITISLNGKQHQTSLQKASK